MRKFFLILFLSATSVAWANPPYPPSSSSALDAAVRAVCPQIDGVGVDGSIFFQSGATCQVAARQAMQNFIPTSPIGKSITFLQFMALFTPGEQAAIIGSNDVQVKIFVVMAAGAGLLQLDNSQVVGGVGYLVSSGLITSDRSKAILAGTPPS